MSTRNLRILSDTPPKATIYLRQSTHRDESISLELQEIACRDYCDRMGYTVVAVESDPGISGRTWKRPAVQRTMQAIEDHETDIVILWKWSRLSRSRKDWALAIDRADVAGGRIESATEPIDTATASGRFARGVMTEYAAFQSEQIGETWEEVRQRRLGRGLPASGRLPFGWRRTDNGIEPHPDQAPWVVEMYRRYLGGDGASMIAKWLNAQRVPSPNGALWSRARPLVVMDSPIHVGLIPYRGATYPGAHDGIIDTAMWEAYNDTRAVRRGSMEKPREYDYLLSNLVRCECGARMHGKGSITAGTLYRGYICGRTLNGHPQRAYISALALDPPVTNWILTFDPELPPARRRQDAIERVRVDAARRELEALERELAAAGRQNLREILPDASFLRIRAELETEMEPLRQQIAAASKRQPDRIGREHLSAIRSDWTHLTTSQRNRIARLIIDRIEIKNSGTDACITTVWGDSSVVDL